MRRRFRLGHALPLAAIPLLASCVAPKEAAPPPPVTPPPVVIAPPSVSTQDWTDGPLTAGTWTYAPHAGGGMARFVGKDDAALFTLRCDGGDVALSRGAAGAFTVTTTSLSRTLQPAADGAAHLRPSDALLDAMAFSRGRLMVRADAAATLVLPVQAEIGRVVEDCRG